MDNFLTITPKDASDSRAKKRRPSSLENVEKVLAWAAQRQCPFIGDAIAEYEKDFPTRKFLRRTRSEGYIWESIVPPKRKRRAPGVTSSAAAALNCSRQTLTRYIKLKGESAVAILLTDAGHPDLANDWGRV